jgi:glycosyltransferase involved in cell wall biosynthesis
VHAHFALHPTVAALAISELAGVPFSFTCHAQDVYRRPAMLAEKARRAQFVVAISRLLRDQYLAPRLQGADSDKVQVIRCGVETRRYRLRPAQTASLQFTILAVARLAEKKGLAHLIEACVLLRERGCAFRCRIIGDGPLFGRLQEQIRSAGLDGAVLLEGPRSEDEVKAALESATIFVQPSIITADGDMEGVPVSLMEAMAIGVPIVATRSGAMHELVGDGQTGLLVASADATALAAAILRLAGDPGLAQRLVTNARRRIEEDFDLDKNIAILNHLLQVPIAQEAAPIRPATAARSVETREQTAWIDDIPAIWARVRSRVLGTCKEQT